MRILAVIGLIGFIWLSMPPFATDDGRPLRVAMLSHSAGFDRQSVFLQWKSPRMKESDVDATALPFHQLGGFGFTHAALTYDRQMPLIPDYVLVVMPRWFLLCLTMLVPMGWILERLARVAALHLTPPKRQCGYCGYSFHSHKEMCPTCHAMTPLCQTA